MATIVLESETGSALVYCGFIFVLYREGLSGWILSMGGLAILLFILTLKYSPYVSLVALVFFVSVGHSSSVGKFGRWLTRELPLIAVLAFLPRLWSLLSNRLVPGADLALADMDPSVTEAVLNASAWSPILVFKPIYVLIPLLVFMMLRAMYRA